MPVYRLSTVTIEIESHVEISEDDTRIDEHTRHFGFLNLESPTNCQMIAAVYETMKNVWLLKQGKRLMVTDIKRIL